MSWEGYEQHVCTNGHEFTVFPYTDYSQEFDGEFCPRCGQPSAWCHQVDQTNGLDTSNPYTYPVTLTVKIPTKYCVCKECNHMHELEPAVYYVPQKIVD